MAYYAYIRTSAEPEEGYSYDDQCSKIEKYALDNGLIINQTFVDNGVSLNISDDMCTATEVLNERQGISELIDVLDKGDAVIALNTNRLWIGTATQAYICRELKRRKAKVISIQQPNYDIYEKDPNSWLYERLHEALDTFVYTKTKQHIWSTEE